MLKELSKNQFIRFLFIGGVNTLFGYGVFAFLVFLGLHYAMAALFGTLLGVLFNFKTTGTIVFNSHNNKLIFKFFVVYGISYILNVASLYYLTLLRLTPYVAGGILILPMAFFTFFLNKRFVF